MATALSADLAGSGIAAGREAAFEAVESAIEGLQGKEAGLVLVFPPAALDADEVAQQVAAAAPRIPVAGMSSGGVIAASGPVEGACSALAFDSSLQVGLGLSEQASRDPRAAGRAAAGQALAGIDRSAGHPLVLLFVDAGSGDQSEMVAGAYSVTGGMVPLAGGGASGQPTGAGSAGTAQFAHGAAYRDSVVAVALLSTRPIGIGITHACRPCGAPALVTRTAARTVLELDARPAEEVYLETFGYDGAPLSDREFEEFAVLHPLGVPQLSGEMRIRHVHGRGAEGGLRCATAIQENAAVMFMEQTDTAICESARVAVDDALARAGGDARAGLVFDCAARKHALGGALQAEIDTTVSSFGQGLPLAGLYTRGEIGRIRGAKGDLNHALVVVAFA